jgi:hypothetical protein
MIRNYLMLLAGMLLLSLNIFAKPIDLMLGARPQGMGGAFTGIADDANAPYWNPAGMALINTMEFGVSNQINQSLSAVNINLCSGVVPVKNIGTVGFYWQMLNSSLEEGTLGDPLAPYRKDFWHEQIFAVSLAKKIWQDLWIFKSGSLGANLDIYNYATKDFGSTGFGLDAGLLTELPYNIRLGLMGRSLVSRLEGESYPAEFRVGAGYNLKINEVSGLAVASDVLFKKDVEYSSADTLNPVATNLKFFEGLEYSRRFAGFTTAIRGGCNFVAIQGRADFPLNINVGLGLGYKNYQLDYAFMFQTSDNTIGPAHHLGVSFKL